MLKIGKTAGSGTVDLLKTLLKVLKKLLLQFSP